MGTLELLFEEAGRLAAVSATCARYVRGTYTSTSAMSVTGPSSSELTRIESHARARRISSLPLPTHHCPVPISASPDRTAGMGWQLGGQQSWTSWSRWSGPCLAI